MPPRSLLLLACLLSTLALGTLALAQTRPATDPLEARYQPVLAMMKSPPAAGVLVVDLGPGSRAAAAGVLPGDLLIEYDRATIKSQDALRHAVAEAAAKGRLDEDADTHVPVRLLRGPEGREKIDLEIGRGPLGLTGRSCEPGVPLPLNPPATPRGELTLEWDKVPTLDSPAASRPASQPAAPARDPRALADPVFWTRLHQGHDFVGVERTVLQRAGRSWALSVRTSFVEAAAVQATQDVTILFGVSDGRREPAFTLEALDLTTPTVRIQAQRKGATLQGTRTSRDRAKSETLTQPTAPVAIPAYALPLVAAAMPQKAGLVLPFAQISELDLQTRLGFCLETLGPKPLRQGKLERTAWAVQVVHFGQPEMTFYFADDRTLLQADLGSDLTAIRAPNESAAQEGILHRAK